MPRNVLREELDNRRYCEGLAFECEGQHYMAQVGYFADGRVAEVFITGNKVGTSTDTAARDASIVFSIASQFGADLETIRKALTRNANGVATGPLGAVLDILAADAKAQPGGPDGVAG